FRRRRFSCARNSPRQNVQTSQLSCDDHHNLPCRKSLEFNRSRQSAGFHPEAVMRLLVFILLTTSFALPEPKTALVPRPFPWRQLTHASGMVFSGEVLDVSRAKTGN